LSPPRMFVFNTRTLGIEWLCGLVQKSHSG
jgi:hypothetical protein